MKKTDKIKELENKVTNLQQELRELKATNLPMYMCWDEDSNFIVKVESIDNNSISGVIINYGGDNNYSIGEKFTALNYDRFINCDYKPKESPKVMICQDLKLIVLLEGPSDSGYNGIVLDPGNTGWAVYDKSDTFNLDIFEDYDFPKHQDIRGKSFPKLMASENIIIIAREVLDGKISGTLVSGSCRGMDTIGGFSTGWTASEFKDYNPMKSDEV